MLRRIEWRLRWWRSLQVEEERKISGQRSRKRYGGVGGVEEVLVSF